MANEETTLLLRQLVGGMQQVQAAQAKTDEKVASLAETVSRITATWKDKAVVQISAIALAALSIIGAQRALAPTPPPATTVVQKSELQIRAEGCVKLAGGNPETYARCMVDQVVAPGADVVAGTAVR